MTVLKTKYLAFIERSFLPVNHLSFGRLERKIRTIVYRDCLLTRGKFRAISNCLVSRKPTDPLTDPNRFEKVLKRKQFPDSIPVVFSIVLLKYLIETELNEKPPQTQTSACIFLTSVKARGVKWNPRVIEFRAGFLRRKLKQIKNRLCADLALLYNIKISMIFPDSLINSFFSFSRFVKYSCLYILWSSLFSNLLTLD